MSASCSLVISFRLELNPPVTGPPSSLFSIEEKLRVGMQERVNCV